MVRERRRISAQEGCQISTLGVEIALCLYAIAPGRYRGASICFVGLANGAVSHPDSGLEMK